MKTLIVVIVHHPIATIIAITDGSCGPRWAPRASSNINITETGR